MVKLLQSHPFKLSGNDNDDNDKSNFKNITASDLFIPKHNCLSFSYYFLHNNMTKILEFSIKDKTLSFHKVN